LRYVHNVSTEEFVNIGVLMWLPEDGQFLHELSEKYSRLSNFFEGFDGTGYRNMVRHIKARLGAAKKQDHVQIKDVEQLVAAILPRDSSCFQWSAPMGGVAINPEQRLQKLYDSIVERHANKQERTRRDEKDIYQTLITRLQQRALAERLQKDVSIKGVHFGYT